MTTNTADIFRAAAFAPPQVSDIPEAPPHLTRWGRIKLRLALRLLPSSFVLLRRDWHQRTVSLAVEFWMTTGRLDSIAARKRLRSLARALADSVRKAVVHPGATP